MTQFDLFLPGMAFVLWESRELREVDFAMVDCDHCRSKVETTLELVRRVLNESTNNEAI